MRLEVDPLCSAVSSSLIRSRVGEAVAAFAWFAGTWDVAVTFKVGPGPERTGTATCEAKWTLDGLFLQQDYKSTSMGRPVFRSLLANSSNQRKDSKDAGSDSSAADPGG